MKWGVSIELALEVATSRWAKFPELPDQVFDTAGYLQWPLIAQGVFQLAFRSPRVHEQPDLWFPLKKPFLSAAPISARKLGHRFGWCQSFAGRAPFLKTSIPVSLLRHLGGSSFIWGNNPRGKPKPFSRGVHKRHTHAFCPRALLLTQDSKTGPEAPLRSFTTPSLKLGLSTRGSARTHVLRPPPPGFSSFLAPPPTRLGFGFGFRPGLCLDLAALGLERSW